MRSRVVLASMLATLWLGAAGAAAAPLDVDTSFGSDGAVELFGGANPGLNYTPPMNAVPTLTGGYAVVTGVADGGGYVISDTRFTAAGAADGTGARTFKPGGKHVSFDLKTAPDGGGGYYVAGVMQRASEHRSFVVHITADRQLDTAFGTGGVVDIPARNGRVDVVSLVRQDDGSLLLTDRRSGFASSDAVVHKLLANGQRDAAFGVAGSTAPVTVGTSFDQGFVVDTVVRASDGRITVVGGVVGDLRLYRWLANGSADTGYGTAGVATPSGFADDLYPRAAAIDSSGRVLVFADSYPSGSRGSVARITAAGARDTSFGGGDGVSDLQAASITSSSATDGLVTAGGDIYYIGISAFGTAPTQRSTIWKVTAGGATSVTASTLTTAAPDDALVVGTNVIAPADDGSIRSIGWSTTGLAVTVNTSTAIASRTIGDELTGVAGTPSGKILGFKYRYGSGTRLPLASITSSGLPDPGLSAAAGFVAGGSVEVRGTDVAADGGLVSVFKDGAAYKVLRFRADGTPDTGFGTAGVKTLPSGDFGDVLTVIAAPNGAIYVVGRTPGIKLAIAKLGTDGTLDGSYGGGDGVFVDTAFGAPSAAGLQSSGAVIVAASSKIVRVTPQGTLDSGYPATVVSGSVEALLVDSGDRIVYDQEADDVNTITRLTAAGQVDGTFGSAGNVVTPAPATTNLRPDTIEQLPSGEYIVTADRFPTSGGPTFVSLLFITDAGALTARHLELSSSSDGVAVLPDGRFAISDAFENTLHAVMYLGAPPAAPTLTAQASGSGIEVTASADARKLTGVSVKTTVTGPGVAGAEEVKQLTASAGVQTVTRTVSGLLPNTDYVVTATVTNASGTSTATDTKVRTAALPCCARITPKASVAKITLPKKSLRSRVSAWRTLKGTATLDGGAKAGGAKLKRVQVNVVKRLKRKKGSKVARCSVFTGKRFSTMSCTKALKKWVTVKGTTKWSVRLKGLGRGTYTARVRAVDTKGRTQTTFKNGTSRVVLKLTR